MISRIWHGWTEPDNADAYEALLLGEIFVGIEALDIRGYRGIELLRQDRVDGTEFVTIMWFDSLEDVRAFAGEDYARAVVPAKARALLAKYDGLSQHYQVIAHREAH